MIEFADPGLVLARMTQEDALTIGHDGSVEYVLINMTLERISEELSRDWRSSDAWHAFEVVMRSFRLGRNLRAEFWRLAQAGERECRQL